MTPIVLQVIDTTPIVSLAEFKLFAKVDETADDVLIPKIIEAATLSCEKYCGIYFRKKKVRWRYSTPWNRESRCLKAIELPFGPNQVITKVSRINTDGSLTEIEGDGYSTHGLSFLSIQVGRRYSLTQNSSSQDSVEVEYTAGYHDAQADPDYMPLEEDVKQAIRLLSGELYENRQTSVQGTIVATLDITHKTLLAPYRRVTLF